MQVAIYHHPKCGTSRAVLQILREAGVEPEIIAYMQTPLTRAQLADLAQKLGGASALVRSKEPLALELDLQNADDASIYEAITEHPILLNRPVVVAAKGAKVCRPAELVRTLL